MRKPTYKPLPKSAPDAISLAALRLLDMGSSDREMLGQVIARCLLTSTASVDAALRKLERLGYATSSIISPTITRYRLTEAGETYLANLTL